MEIKIKKLTPGAIIPQYKTVGSAGVDLHADLTKLTLDHVYLKPGKSALIDTGLSIELPIGYEAQIRPRSGLALKNEITVLNSPGTLDSDYRGSIGVILINHSTEYFKISHGDRIAQMVIAPVIQAQLIESDNLSETERGQSGFGHTGV